MTFVSTCRTVALGFVCVFSSRTLCSNEYGATALGQFEKMDLAEIRQKLAAKELEQNRVPPLMPPVIKSSPGNNFYKTPGMGELPDFHQPTHF